MRFPWINIGLLGIELHTRRRNRVNGTVTAIDSDRFEVQVGQSFGLMVSLPWLPKSRQATAALFLPASPSHLERIFRIGS